MAAGFPTSFASLQTLGFVRMFHFCLAVAYKMYLIMGLIFTSLVTSKAGHLFQFVYCPIRLCFTCVLPIHVFFFFLIASFL